MRTTLPIHRQGLHRKYAITKYSGCNHSKFQFHFVTQCSVPNHMKAMSTPAPANNTNHSTSYHRNHSVSP